MLSIEHLYFSYQGQPPYVLNDLNLHIHSGDYISIVGDNGSGKSTLLRLILGFLKPVKGSIKDKFFILLPPQFINNKIPYKE